MVFSFTVSIIVTFSYISDDLYCSSSTSNISSGATVTLSSGFDYRGLLGAFSLNSDWFYPDRSVVGNRNFFSGPSMIR